MAVSNTLLIEGSFEELADELAQYIDSLKKDGDEQIQPEVQKLLQDGKKEDALKKLVSNAIILNSAPEKAVIPAYNLLLHIARQVPDPSRFFAKICGHLSQPMANQQHGSGLALTLLSTMFNLIPPEHESRYHVLMAILKVVKSASSYDSLKPQLKSLQQWLTAWGDDVDEEEQRRLFLAVANVAADAGESEDAYAYTIKALRTIPADEASSDEAHDLALKALKAALQAPTHFDFQDITSLDAVQALRKSEPTYFELLELFTSEQLDDLNDFKDDNDGWIEEQGLDKSALDRKMRLLTLASLAASTGQTRQLPYTHIAKALQIPESDVELWVIDVIRAGLVEGKLSQLNKTFLIHRSTYRVFGENQWREVAARLDMWKTSLASVLQIVRQERESFKVTQEQERKEADAKAGGEMGDRPMRDGGGGGGRGGFRGRGQQRSQQQHQPQQPQQSSLDVDAD